MRKMRLNEIKQQAIGKHIFVDGADKGKIADVRRGVYAGWLVLLTDKRNGVSVRQPNFYGIINGRVLRQAEDVHGVACPELGYHYYEIKEINNEQPSRSNRRNQGY